MALTLLGYLATAAAFYYLAARSAMKVEEKNTSLPSQVSLTVVEGGASKTSETRKVA